LDLNFREFHDLFVQSIQPIIDAKFAFRNSPLADLAASKGLTLSSLNNDSIFDVIVTVLSVSAQDVSFIFNWTEQERTKLQTFPLQEVASYREITFENIGSYKLFEFVEYVSLLSAFTVPPSSLPTRLSLSPCESGLQSGDSAFACTGSKPLWQFCYLLTCIQVHIYLSSVSLVCDTQWHRFYHNKNYRQKRGLFLVSSLRSVDLWFSRSLRRQKVFLFLIEEGTN